MCLPTGSGGCHLSTLEPSSKLRLLLIFRGRSRGLPPLPTVVKRSQTGGTPRKTTTIITRTAPTFPRVPHLRMYRRVAWPSVRPTKTPKSSRQKSNNNNTYLVQLNPFYSSSSIMLQCQHVPTAIVTSSGAAATGDRIRNPPTAHMPRSSPHTSHTAVYTNTMS